MNIPLIPEFTEPLYLTVPYPPSANAYWVIARGHIIVSARAKAYKKTIKNSYLGRDLYTQPISLTIDVYRPQKVGDLDNTLKVMLDAFKGVIYKDDAQIVEIWARRFDDKFNPRAEITIYPGCLTKEAIHAVLSRK